MFAESVARIDRRKTTLDAFVGYLKAEKEAYSVVAAFGRSN